MKHFLLPAMFVLLSGPVAAQQAGNFTAAPAGIGIIRRVVGSWYIEGQPGRRLQPGQEFPKGASLRAEALLSDGPDNRAIEIVLFDGRNSRFSCSVAMTCEGPIPVTLRETGWDRDFADFVQRLIRRIFGRQQLQPLIVGGQLIPLHGNTVWLGKPTLTLSQDTNVLAFTQARQGPVLVSLCTPSEVDKCDLSHTFSPEEWNSQAQLKDYSMKVNPGLYDLRVHRTVPMDKLTPRYVVLALSSGAASKATAQFVRATQLPFFGSLDKVERGRAEGILITVIGESAR